MIVPNVCDLEGQPRTWSWLLQTFGDVQILPAAAEPEQDVYRVVRVRVKHSYGLLTARVRQSDGSPQAGACVVFRGPGAPWLTLEGDLLPPACSLLPPERGVAARTGASGRAEFRTGPDDDYLVPYTGAGPERPPGLPEAGLSTLYVRDLQAPSDLVTGLGVLRLGDNGYYLHATFQRVSGGGEPWQPDAGLDPSVGRLATGQAVILDLLAQIAEHLGMEM